MRFRSTSRHPWRSPIPALIFVLAGAVQAGCSESGGDDGPRGLAGGGQGKVLPAGGSPVELVSRERLATLTQRLVRINSEYEYGVVHNHEDIAEFIARELRDIGLEVEVVRQNPEFPVVVGRLRGTAGKPAIGFWGEYNSVKLGNRSLWTVDPFGGEIRNGRIYGRGATNSKGTVAVNIETARVLKQSGVTLTGDAIFLFVPGEGGSEFCMPWVVEHRPELVRADWYLMGGGGGRFGRMEGGHHWIKLITKGQQGHPPSTNFVNAVHKMLTVLPEVLKVEGWMTWKAEGLFKDERPYVDVGKVVGGYQVNIVPDRAEADLDIRTLPNQTREQVERELNALLARLKAEDPQLDVEVQWIWKGRVAYEAWSKVNEDDPLVQAITEIAPKYTGKPVTWSNRIGRGGGRPDLWRVGAKVIYFGVGSNTGANAHGIDEWVSIDGLVEKARFQTEVTAHILR